MRGVACPRVGQVSSAKIKTTMIRKVFTYLSFCIAAAALFACSPIDDGGNNGGGNNGGGNTELPDEERNLYAFLCQIADDNKAARKNGGEIKHVYIVSHRGNTKAGKAAGAPDNSVPAIGYAVANGADMVELDVRTTSDGHFVMVHDETIKATTGKNLKVADLTLEEIQSYAMISGNGKYYKDADGNYTYTPTLKQVLEACKDKIYVNLDIKAVSNRRKLIREIVAAGMGNQVMTYESGYSTCRNYIEYAIEEGGIYNFCVHPHISKSSDTQQYKELPSAKLFQYSYNIWVDGTSISRDLHKDNLLTYSNILTYDSKIYSGNYTYLDKFLESDTDFIQTDYCEIVHDYLKSKGLR